MEEITELSQTGKVTQNLFQKYNSNGRVEREDPMNEIKEQPE